MTGGPVHDFVARHRKGLQWGVMALALVLLVLWNKPTVLVAVVILLVAFALIGLVGLFARLERSEAGGGSDGADDDGPVDADGPGDGSSGAGAVDDAGVVSTRTGGSASGPS